MKLKHFTHLLSAKYHDYERISMKHSACMPLCQPNKLLKSLKIRIIPEQDRIVPPMVFRCERVRLWWVPSSCPQVLLGHSQAACLRCPRVVPAGRTGGLWDFRRLSIRKLFPELPKPGNVAAIFLLVQLWTKSILLKHIWCSSFLFRSHSSVTLDSLLILSQLTWANFIKLRGRQKFSGLLLSGLYFALGLWCDWLRGSNVFLNSDKAGAFLEWQKVGLPHSLCQIAY